MQKPPEIEFSRQACERDPENYVVVRLRVPRGGGDESFFGDFTGVTAQHKAAKFVLATASGMLHALGVASLAQAVEYVGAQIALALADREKRVN